MAVKVGMVSLGCSKNQVDAEILLALMVNNGYELCADPEQCDVVIINTCVYRSFSMTLPRSDSSAVKRAFWGYAFLML